MKSSKNIVNEKKGLISSGGQFLSIILPGLTIVALLFLWELFVFKSNIDKWILPSPLMIIKSFWQVKGLIWEHSLQTILETIIGFTIGVISAMAVSTILDFSDWLKKAFYPLLIVSQTIPILAIAPLFIIWFGYGIAPKVVVVALVCFFPIAINLIDGYQSVDRDMIKLMLSMGANRRQIFHMVKLPASLPFFFSGLKIAGTYSIMGAVIGEWLGASKGLGVFMTRSSQSFLTDRVFAAIMAITVLSLLVVGIIEFIARISMAWYFKQRESN